MGQQFSATELNRADRLVFGVLQALVLVAGLGYLGFAVYHYLVDGRVVGSDLSVLWTAAQITSLEDLQLAYSADVFSTAAAQPYWGGAAGNPYQYFAYPPHFLLFLWPIGQVPYVFAFFIYALINPLILAAVVWAAFQRSWYAAGFVVLAPAAFFSLWVGQTGTLACALLIGGMAFLERRPILAGILIGLLTFKPPLGVIIPFALLAGRYWRTFISAVLTVVALLLLSIAVHGTEVWITYFTSVPDRHLELYTSAQSLITNLVPTVFRASSILGFGDTAGLVAQGLVAAVVLACAMWAFHSRRDLGLNCALLFSGTLLVSPFGHIYDLSMVSAAVFLLLQDMALRGAHRGERMIAVVAWLLPFPVYFLNGAGLPIGPLVLGLLFGAIMHRLCRLDRQPNSHGSLAHH